MGALSDGGLVENNESNRVPIAGVGVAPSIEESNEVDRTSVIVQALPPVLGVMALAAWAFLALVHIADRYEVGWVMGARMGLARSFANGTLYPPLFDGRFFGGTRFMPIPFVLHGWLARATGEFVISGKILAYASFVFLLVVTFSALRRVGCPQGIAFGLTAIVLLTGAGLVQASSFYADALPVALQVTAVNLILHSPRRRTVVAAAALSALALFTKSSAIWAPVAIFLWARKRERRRALEFAFAYAATALLLLGIFEIVSQGRFLANIVGLTFAGRHDFVRILWWPFVMIAEDPTALVVLSFGIVGTVVAIRRREATLYHHCFIWASVVLLIILTDPGASSNHTIDIIVLGAILTGELWAHASVSVDGARALRVGLAGVLSLSMLFSLVSRFGPRVAFAASTVLRGEAPDDRYSLDPLGALVRPGDTILSEDPTIPLLLGQQPLVLDAWMLRAIAERHPDWAGRLVARIDAHEFDDVILLTRLGTQPRGWYTDVDFGSAVITAIQRDYRYETTSSGYSIYVPKSP